MWSLVLFSVYSRTFCSFAWLGSEIKKEKKTEPHRARLTQPFLAAHCNVDLKRTHLCGCLINLEAQGDVCMCLCLTFWVYLFCILSICPELSLFHVHRQKSYSLQKPIRQAGQQIIEVMISASKRQLIVIVSEAAPNKICTLCLLQPSFGKDRIWNNMDMSDVHQQIGWQCIILLGTAI